MDCARAPKLEFEISPQSLPIAHPSQHASRDIAESERDKRNQGLSERTHPASTLGGYGRDQAAWAAAVTVRRCQGSSSVMRLAG